MNQSDVKPVVSMKNNVLRFFVYIVGFLVLLLTIIGLFKYEGQLYIFLAFSVVSNFAVFYGFRERALFFDVFIAIFLWLGIWLKFVVRIVFLDGVFSESIGVFSGSAGDFDRALLVATSGIFSLVLMSFLREKFVFSYPKKIDDVGNKGIFEFYKRNRRALLLGFVSLFVMIAITNMYFGIYQRGEIPTTVLPFGLSGVYKWLLLFGLASFTAIILRFEFFINKTTTYLVIVIGLLESFSSNVSLFSRGMVLNASALALGVARSLNVYDLKSNARTLLASLALFSVLFIISIFVVTQLRANDSLTMYQVSKKQLEGNILGEKAAKDLIVTGRNIKMLFLDRWIGIEGIMAISSSPEKGWKLLLNAIGEEFSGDKAGFYDAFTNSSYVSTDKNKHYYQSLPGIIAFLFYSGSYVFLFISMFALGAFASLIEILVFRFGGKNLILCSLIAQVVAYRYSHFGYVPKQSYLLFGAIFMNLILIYSLNKFLCYWYQYKNVAVD